METTAKKIKKVQSKIGVDLLEHIEKQRDFSSMNSYIKTALIEKSNFKPKRKQA
jgi:hypothetical protein